MAPTVQTGRREDREKRSRTGEKRSDLVCRVKYNNTLPDIPFDPKFITYPFESNRFFTYKPTSLERSFKYDLLTEHDLGVTIDLINPNTYKIDPNAYPEAEDEKLLEEDLNTPGDGKRSRHHNTNVSWLRKTEYISTEYNRFIQKNDKSEAKVGFKIKQIMKDDDIYKDRETQIKSINETFEKAKIPITKHFSKPGVTPVQVSGVFPDFELWKHPFAQVLFDSDPAPKGYSAPVQMEEMSQAMIRGAVDESGDQFVAYFLPTDETLGKRKRDFTNEKDYEDDESYEYLLAREYNWNVKNKLSKGYEETYFFIMREDGVYYNELETRVRLSKRRKNASSAQVKSRLVVKHRDLSDKEVAAQDGRMQMLEPPGEEEEEEEEEELMPDLTAEVANGEDERGERSGDEGSDEEIRPRRRKIESDDEDEDKASVRSGSRSDKSRSRSRSASRSRSRSGSRNRSRSQSRSKSRSASRSRSRSKSGSRSRSGSRSKSRSRSRTPSRSRSRSRSGSRRSGSRSVSRSRSRSRSGSRSVSRSRSRSKSASRSRSRSVSRSRSRSRSRSASGSASSRSRSRSKTPSERGDSESEAEEEDKGRKDEEEIFGSASSSEESD